MNLLFIGRAFSPFTLPLFFNYIHSGNPLESGVIGALANTLLGVSCRVEVDYGEGLDLDFIYGDMHLQIPWLEEAIKSVLKLEGIKGLRGFFDYNFEANFGLDISSTSAILIASLAALKKALKLRLNPIDIGLLSHETELNFKVGFGCTYSQLLGGITLFLTPSVPGKARYVKFSFPSDLRIILAGTPMNTFPTYDLNVDLPSISSELNSIKSFDDLISTSIKFQNFLPSLSPRLGGIINRLKNLDNILSYGFGFLGKTIYVLAYRDYLVDVISILIDFFPTEYIIVSELDPVGVRVYL